MARGCPKGAAPWCTDGTRMRRSLPLLLITAALVGLIGVARGGTATNTLTSQTTVSSACNVSGSTLAFGSAINPIGAGPVNGTSTLTIECTATTAYTVALSAGSNAGGAANFSTRKMINGAYTLGYQLYVDGARTSVWGNSTGGSTVYSGVGSGGVQSVTIYGQVPSLTGAVPGAYTDTVTVTVTY
jgi:spore coat protein U-like protein